MKFSHIAAAAAVAFCALQANAVTIVAAPSFAGTYGALPFASSTLTSTVTGSVGGVNLAPEAPVPTEITSAYSLISTGGSATLDVTGSTFSFLWGSPDGFNSVLVDGITFTGNDLGLGHTAAGINTDSRWVTLSGITGDEIVFSSGGTAFELAVAAVPEPETYALLLAGLAAVGFVARRRKSA